ncbi:hypothetical protein WMY93_008254 [Mugilogobius chulae]|uniref:Uncharacterized protein n=1 Tax=Mugilogobius chulae TaxID=88201 RepID=A0AAW0PLV4_9GOBI
MMFLVRIPLFLCAMPFPVLRSMMSKIVSKSEQGALFACISCLESLTNTVSSAVFNSIYAATTLIVMRVDFSEEDKQILIDEQGLIQDQNDNRAVIN